MSAPSEVASILDQWLQLTRQEAAAIEKSAWSSLRQIKAHKNHLRDSLDQAVRHCRERGISLHSFAPIYGRIVSLLNRNGATLAARLRQGRHRRTSLQENERTLLRIRHTYTRPSATVWHSFS